jgi:hypothetical protein
MAGLAVKRFVTKEGKNLLYVEVGRAAQFYPIDENPAKDDKKTEDRPSNDYKAPVQNKTIVTTGGLVSLYSGILKEMELQIGEGMWEAMLTDPRSISAAASTVFIEACKNGLQRSAPIITTTPVLGTVSDLARYLSSPSFSSEEYHHAKHNLGVTAGAIWDEAYKLIPKEYSDDEVTAAWDSFDKAISNSKSRRAGSEEICDEICTSWPSFLLALETAKMFKAVS